MDKYKILGLVFLILFSTFVISNTNYQEIQNIVSTESYNTVNIDGYYDSGNGVYLNLSRDDTKLLLYNVSNIENINNIYFNPNTEYDTSAISLHGISFDYATIYLKKNKEGFVNKILHSSDGYNFSVDYSINLTQNNTHVWFNVKHFSSWTSAMDDITIYYDVLNDDTSIVRAEIDVEQDYADVDPTDCVVFGALDDTSYTQLSSCGGANSGTYGYRDDNYGVDIFDVYILAEAIYLTPTTSWQTIDETHTDNNGFPDPYRIEIFDSTLTTLEANSGYVDLRVKSFNHPDATSQSATTVTENSAYLNCNVDRDDLENLQYYTAYYNPSVGSEWVRFKYREVGTSTWLDSSDYDNPTDGEDVSIQVTSLSSGTQYEYYCTYSYVDITEDADLGGVTSTVVGNIFYFTTESNEPTVTTLSAIEDDTKAKLRALVDYKTYGGSDLGLAFYYKEYPSGSYTRVPTSGWFTPTDDVIYTTDYVTGLTNNQLYEYYATITWDSGSNNLNGSVSYFTPNPPSSGTVSDFTEDNVLWLDVNENDSTIFDFSGSVSSISNTGVTVSDDDMVFDGADNLNLGTNVDTPRNGNMTLIGCFETDLANTQQILLDRDGSTTGRYNFFIDSSGYYRGLIKDTSSNQVLSTADGSTYSQSTLYHYTVVFDRVNNQIVRYVNGTQTGTKDSISSIGDVNPTASIIIGSSFDGNLKYIAQYNRNMTGTEIEELVSLGCEYNPYITIEDIITPENLPYNNLNYDSVTLNGVASYNETLYDVYGSFRWRINGSSTWINETGLVPQITSDTTFSLNLSSLSDNTKYEYQSWVTYENLENNSVISFSESSYFTTSVIPPPSILTLSAVNVTSSEAVLRVELLDLYGWNDTNLYFLYKEIGGIYITSSTQNVNETGIYYLQLTNLTELTNYTYRSMADYTNNYNETTNGNNVLFSTSEFGAPVINTLDASSIKRDEARLNCEILSLGLYTEIEIYFNIFNESYNINTTSETYTSLFTVSKLVQNLSINKTYNYTCYGVYDSKSLNGGTTSFKTLSLLDKLYPEVGGQSPTDILSDKVNLIGFLDPQDYPNGNYSFTVYKDTGTFTEIINSSGPIFTNVTEFTQFVYTTSNLESNTKYFYNFKYNYDINGTPSYNISNNYYFTTKDNVESPKYVEIWKNIEIWVEDPYYFSLLLIVGVTVLSLFFTFGYGIMKQADIKILVYLILGFSLVLELWAYFQQIIPSYQIIITLVGVLSLGGYYFLADNRGAVYG